MAGQSISLIHDRKFDQSIDTNIISLELTSDCIEAKPASALHWIALGPDRIIWSSSALPWNGILLERHRYSPGERMASSIDRHVISMSHHAPARFEYRNLGGEFATVVLRPKTIMITPAGLVPDIRLHTSAELTHCVLENEFLRRVAAEIDCPAHCPTFHPGIEERSIQRILGLLTDELEAEHPSGRLYVDSLIYALAARYVLLDVGNPARSRSRVTGLMPRILNRVRTKIEANLDADLSLESLAEESGYSRAHFLRMFRTATGLTPHQYVLDLRLRRAQDCLRQAKSSIIDVALSCGFSSQSHMTSVFRRNLEMTPGEFRRKALS